MNEMTERTQDRLYHGLGVPAKVEDLRRQVREFVATQVAPVVAAMEERAEDLDNFPRTLFERMAHMGLFGIPYTTEEGGAGLSTPMLAAAVVMEELAYESNSLAVIYDCQSVLAGRVLQYASPALKAAWLPSVISGERIACFAVTEPGAGSDISPSSIGTVAAPVSGGWRLTGHKRFINNAPVADFACVLCTIDGALSIVIMDMKADGVTVPPPDRKIGMHSALTSDILMDGVFVPEENLVWQAGKGLRIVLGSLTRGRIAVAASGVGMAQAAFDESVRRMKERQMFGGTLAAMQYWQFRLAERATELTMARDLYTKAALRHDAGEEFPEPETAMAKVYGTRIAGDIARDAIQIFGGYGCVSRLGLDGSSFKVERILRDAKSPEVYEGSNEIQKWMVARQIFGR